jgi:VWFA-related protein
MHASAFLVVSSLVVCLSVPAMADISAQDAQPTFRAQVDVVTIAAVVRDQQGRVVQTLTKDDFVVLDGGDAREITEFQPDSNGPINVALLMDGSGSMAHLAASSRRACRILFTQLNARSDDVALMSFDTRLLKHRGFTNDFEQLRAGLDEIDTFGASSIYDAIAGAAGVVADYATKRRAVIVVTDGSDNWSTYSPSEVAWIASTIDVPIYVVAVATRSGSSLDTRAIGGELGDLARATGGEYFAADTETRQAMALGRIVEDLRHQYLIAIEPSGTTGLRSLDIRTRKDALKVRARQWYSADVDD